MIMVPEVRLRSMRLQCRRISFERVIVSLRRSWLAWIKERIDGGARARGKRFSETRLGLHFWA